jgi:hypothetical protein
LGGEEDILESLAKRGVVVWRVRVAKGRSVRGVLVRRRGVSVVRRVENIWFIGRREKKVERGNMQVVSLVSVDCLCGHHFIYAIMVSTSFL